MAAKTSHPLPRIGRSYVFQGAQLWLTAAKFLARATCAAEMISNGFVLFKLSSWLFGECWRFMVDALLFLTASYLNFGWSRYGVWWTISPKRNFNVGWQTEVVVSKKIDGFPLFWERRTLNSREMRLQDGFCDDVSGFTWRQIFISTTLTKRK